MCVETRFKGVNQVQMGVSSRMSSLKINKFHSLVHDSNHYIKGSSNQFVGTRIRGRSMLSQINFPKLHLISIKCKFVTPLITSLQPTTKLRLSIAFSSFDPTAAVCTQPKSGNMAKTPLKTDLELLARLESSNPLLPLPPKKARNPQIAHAPKRNHGLSTAEKKVA